MIASARMYAWAPSLVMAWRRLLQRVTARARVALEFVDSPSVALDELWAREDMGCVFMCGYPYALRADRPALLAVLVPFPARFGGTAVYVTDFIVRADGPHKRLEDTFGGTIAYSTELLRFDRVVEGDFQLFPDWQRAAAAGYAKLWQMVGAPCSVVSDCLTTRDFTVWAWLQDWNPLGCPAEQMSA